MPRLIMQHRSAAEAMMEKGRYSEAREQVIHPHNPNLQSNEN